jgi:hypothetical protein
MLLSRNAATVIFHINHRHHVTRTIVNRHLSEPKKIKPQNRLTPIPLYGLLNRQLTTLGHADNLNPTREINLDQNSSNPYCRATNRTSGLIPSPRYSGERVRVRGLRLLFSPSASPAVNTGIPTPQPSRPQVPTNSFGVSPHHRDLHPPVKKTSRARVSLAVPGIRPPQNRNHLSPHESPSMRDHSAGVIDHVPCEVTASTLLRLTTHVMLVKRQVVLRRLRFVTTKDRVQGHARNADAAADVAGKLPNKNWGVSHQLKTENDGGVVLNIVIGDARQFKVWVRCLGPKATVFDRTEPIKEIRDNLIAINSNYQPITSRLRFNRRSDSKKIA